MTSAHEFLHFPLNMATLSHKFGSPRRLLGSIIAVIPSLLDEGAAVERAVVLRIDGAIGPSAAVYVGREFHEGEPNR